MVQDLRVVNTNNFEMVTNSCLHRNESFPHPSVAYVLFASILFECIRLDSHYNWVTFDGHAYFALHAIDNVARGGSQH